MNCKNVFHLISYAIAAGFTKSSLLEEMEEVKTFLVVWAGKMQDKPKLMQKQYAPMTFMSCLSSLKCKHVILSYW